MGDRRKPLKTPQASSSENRWPTASQVPTNLNDLGAWLGLVGNSAVLDLMDTGQASASGLLLGPILGIIGCDPNTPEVPAPDADLRTAIQAVAKSSPLIATALKKLVSEQWIIERGPSGKGSKTVRDQSPKRLVLDEDLISNRESLMSTIAHELGHFLAGAPAYQYDPSMDRDKYIRTNTWIDLDGEASATIMELEVRQEQLDKGEGDLGLTGVTAKEKKKLWQEHQAGSISKDELRVKLADLFAEKEVTSDTSLPYWEHYARSHADAWDRANPPVTPLPLPGPK